MNVTAPVHRQFGLDLVRGIAVGLVVVSHFSRKLDSLGFWGVELFFGLSGYLIGGILWRSFSTTTDWTSLHLVNFWSRRWWRTLPNYYLFLPIYFIADSIFFPNSVHLADMVPFLWFGQKLVAHKDWFYGVSWSLCIEEWFYLLFPLLLFGLSKFERNASQTFGLAILVIFVGCLLARFALVQQGSGDYLRVITVGRLDAIACGVLVTFGTIRLQPTARHQRLLFGLGLVLLSAAALYPILGHVSFDEAKNNTYLLLLTPLGGALLLPYCSTLPRPGGVWAAGANAIEHISLWSFSIYLSHSVIFETVCGLQDMYKLDSLRVLNNLPIKLLTIGLIIPISALLYRYFELPLTQKRPAEFQLTAKQPATVG